MTEEKKEENKQELNPYFYSLVMSLVQAGLQQLGKVSNPITGRVEKNLNECQLTIDMLEMLREKTSGNLGPDELQALQHGIADLKMNYSDEASKKSEPEKPITH